MNGHTARIAFALILLLTLTFQTSFGQQVAPDAPRLRLMDGRQALPSSCSKREHCFGI
jgi:hypothetical protein